MKRWRVLLLPLGILLFLAAAEVIADYRRLTYMPGETTILLHPSGDASLVGSWTVTEGADVYDELDDPAYDDGYTDHDSSGTTANIAPNTNGRVELDMENNAGYADANAQIRWVSMRLVVNRTDGFYVYNGVSSGVLIAGTDYELTAPTTITSAYMLREPYNNANPAGTLTRYTTNPNTGLAWTSADLDAIKLYIEETANPSATATIRYSEAAVIVNLDKAYSDYQIPRRVSGGGD